MPELRCRLIVWSYSSHTSQVSTGLVMRARQGLIRLSQEVRKTSPELPGRLRRAREAHLLLVVNDSLKLYFDMHDSRELDEEALDTCDVYFKRGFAPDSIPLRHRAKVLPLGLNYEIYPSGFDRLEAARRVVLARGPADRIGKLARAALSLMTGKTTMGRYRPEVSSMCAPPDPGRAPRVLFMTRVWDPDEITNDSPQKIASRIAINEMRAECILRLRRELGARFTGGLQHTEYARRRFPAALLEEDRLSEKGEYLRLLKTFPICIATTGLHDSNGWKLAEYVAFSKAIVTEPLCHCVPGDFSEGRNFLVFHSTAECVEKIAMLIEQPGLMRSIMENNWRYYHTYLRPDLLVKHALDAALARRESVNTAPAGTATSS